MTQHDEAIIAKVAEALWERDRCPKPWAGYDTCYVHGANWSESGQWCEAVERWSRAVLDALDLPGRERRTTARFRAAVELTVQDVRAQRGDHIAGLVEDSFDAHFARAAELDPEEGDDGRV